MSTPSNGGCAFPNHPGTASDGPNGGMSLRDWFAGQVVAEAYQAHIGIGNEPAVSYETARVAYLIADAMLAQRSAPTTAPSAPAAQQGGGT